MDDVRFDTLARCFASRRSVIAGLSVLLTALAWPNQTRAVQFGPQGIALGEPCATTGECSQQQPCSGWGSVICSQNSTGIESGLTCCAREGGSCLRPEDCCLGLQCVGAGGDGCGAGGCFYPGSIGTSIGGSCVTAADCSQRGGVPQCETRGTMHVCCRNDRGECSDAWGCCGNAVCMVGACQTVLAGDVFTTLSALNLRVSPNNPVLLVIPLGATVTATGKINQSGFIKSDFIQVTYQGVVGWVLGSLLVRTEPMAA